MNATRQAELHPKMGTYVASLRVAAMRHLGDLSPAMREAVEAEEGPLQDAFVYLYASGRGDAIEDEIADIRAAITDGTRLAIALGCVLGVAIVLMAVLL